MVALRKGRYMVRLAAGPGDIAAAQQLRALCFGLTTIRDVDIYDQRQLHFLVEDTVADELVCCFRMMAVRGDRLGDCYAAQFYDLSALASYDGLMVELGRFCVYPGLRDPDIQRAAWAAIGAFVDGNDVRLLFGCSSFAGVETSAYLDVFAMLKARHLAPKRWLPKVKAPDVFRYAARLRRKPDLKKAMAAMPQMLRAYLTMGGWVSDHAVVDRHMNTLHVFTGLEIGAIPDGRKRQLRALF